MYAMRNIYKENAMSDIKRGGDTSVITREYFDSLLVEMRHIDSVEPDLSLSLYGHTFATPVMFAALSHLGRVHPGGMAEAAKGIEQAGAVMWAGMGDEAELDAIIETGAKTIKIIKPYADESVVLRKIEHARRVGAIAVGMDVDHAFGSKGERGAVLRIPMKPVSLDLLKRYIKAADGLPFIVKGVLSVQDALKCVDAGAGGIVVSYHHGMVDYAVPPLMVLPDIAMAVNGAFPIFVDCCVERGLDVFKALALGASAVSVGRALMPPLGESGAEGVSAKIAEIGAELSWAMAVTGSPSIREIDSGVLRSRK
jgi:isopentenyl diphosphate isomerase/L-lactate dehydrogenase-like FMN-dependent dehydrogenase